MLLVFILIFVTNPFDMQVRADDPLQLPIVPITAQNAKQLTQLGTIGTGRLTGSAWSPDGTSIAYTTPTGVWLISRESDEREKIASVENASYPIFSDDGFLLAWTNFDSNNQNSIIIWDMKAQKPIFEQHHLTSPIIQLLFATNNEKIYSGSKDGQLQVWDIKTARPIQSEQIAEPNVGVWRFFIRPNSELIVDKAWGIWRYDAQLHPIERIIDASWGELDPSGRLLAVSIYEDKTYSRLRLYDLDTNQFTQVATYKTIGLLNTFRWSPTSAHLIFEAVTGTYLVWDIYKNTWKSLFSFNDGDGSACTQCFDPNGQHVLGSRHGLKIPEHLEDVTLDIREVDTTNITDTIPIVVSRFSVFCTPYVVNLIISQLQSDPQSVKDCGLALNIPESATNGYILQVAQSRNAEFLAGTNFSITTYVWERKSGQLISTYKTGSTDSAPAFTPSFSADLDVRWLAMPRKTGGVQIANRQTGQIAALFDKAFAAVFSTSNDQLFVLTRATSDVQTSYLRIYDTSPLSTSDANDPVDAAQHLPVLREIPLTTENFPRMVVSSEGRKLAVFTGIDLRIIDVSSGQMQTFKDNFELKPRIISMTFTNDNSAIIYTATTVNSSVTDSGRLVIQDVATGEVLKTFDVPAYSKVVLSEDGRSLLTGDNYQGVLSLWSVQ